MRKISVALSVAAAYALPIVALAQQQVRPPNFTYVGQWMNGITDTIGLLTPIIFAIAILYFFWGLAKFIMAAGDEEARAQGKKVMIWGVVALFVMVSVYGLVQILGNIAGINQGGNINLPRIPNQT